MGGTASSGGVSVPRHLSRLLSRQQTERLGAGLQTTGICLEIRWRFLRGILLLPGRRIAAPERTSAEFPGRLFGGFDGQCVGGRSRGAAKKREQEALAPPFAPCRLPPELPPEVRAAAILR